MKFAIVLGLTLVSILSSQSQAKNSDTVKAYDVCAEAQREWVSGGSDAPGTARYEETLKWRMRICEPMKAKNLEIQKNAAEACASIGPIAVAMQCLVTRSGQRFEDINIAQFAREAGMVTAKALKCNETASETAPISCMSNIGNVEYALDSARTN